MGKQLVIWWVIISFSGTLWGPWAMEASADSAVQRSLSPPQVAAPSTLGPSRVKPSHRRSQSRPQSSSQHPLPQHPQHESPPISLEQDFLLPKRPRYQPYLEIGGVKYSGSGGNIAGVAELFIPVVESKQRLMFLDLRIFDRKGGAFEGNIQVGYRQFFEEQEQLVGLYGGWDRKKSEYGGYFNQLMGGMEYWWRNWFIGGNIYHPLGNTRRLVSEESWSKTKTKLEEVDDGVYRYRETMISGKKSLHKEALSGWDGEIGYAINEELTGYLGGYYFKGERGGRISGPRARISYEYGMKAGRILGIIDGLKVELGAQKDQERGGKIYLGVRIRIGLGGERKGGQLQGLERHMENSIRRDPDIVVERDEKREEEQRRIEFVELGGRRKKEDPREKLRRLLKEFGVEEGAGWQQVRERYREYARQYHPDRPHNHSRSRESSRKFGHYQGLYGKLEGFAEELKQRDQVAEYVARGEVKTEPRAGGASEGGGVKTESGAAGGFRGEAGVGGGTGTDSQGESSEDKSERARWLRWVRARESGAEEKAGPSAEGWLAVPTPAPTPIKIRGQTHNLTRWLAPPAGTPNVTINATIPLNSPVANPIANPVLKLVDGLLSIIWPIREVGAQVDPNKSESGTPTPKTTPYPDPDQLYLSILRKGKLSLELIDLILEDYAEDQKYFSNVVIAILAEVKNIPQESLKRLIPSLLSAPDKKKSLFIALRLVQQRIKLPENVLNYFVNYLISDDPIISLRAINLFHELKQSLSKDTKQRLINRAITALSITNGDPHLKLLKILSQFKLTAEQEARKYLQELVTEWHQADSLATKNGIWQKIVEKITVATINDVLVFYKYCLNSQHSKIYQSAGEVLTESNRYFGLFLTDEEQELIKLYNIWHESSKKCSFDERSAGISCLSVKGGEILLTKPQQDRFKKIFRDYPWLNNELKNIEFSGFAEMDKFINYVSRYNLSQTEISKAITRYSWHVTPGNIYLGLLEELVDQSSGKVPASYEGILKSSADRLVNRFGWPADRIWSLLKRVNTGDFLEYISYLELLENYGVRFDLIDRTGLNGLTVLENGVIEIENAANEEGFMEKILSFFSKYFTKSSELKKSSENTQIFSEINHLIQDNYFYPVKDFPDLMKEFAEHNKGNAKLENLLAKGYFEKQLDAIEKATADLTQPKYRVRITEEAPKNPKKGDIYLYRKSENVEVKNDKAKKEIGICIASSLKTVCLNRTNPISPDSKFLKEYLYLDELIASRKKDIPFICQTAIHKGVISTSVYEYISLPYWTSDEFREWRRKIKKVTKENLAQVIAVLAQGVKEIILDGKGYPRDSQLISLLSLLKSPEGGLLQISTGEGKTLIIALFAAIQVMNGKKVGVITSSEDLATRELDKNKSKTSDFFEVFGIKVAHNINENAGEQKCYKSDVVYGDLRHFIGDYLRDISRNVMMGEGPDILVVDEVDNMFMDEIRMLVQLSWSMPGFEFLNSIFVNMWGTATSTVPNLVKKGGNWYIKYDIGKNETLTNLLDDIEFEEDGIKFTKDHEFLFNVGSDIRKFMRGFLKNYTSEQLLALNHKREHRNIVIPPQLEGYARDQVPQWVDSLLRSYQFKNKGQYLKHVNPSSTLSHNATIVAPVDYENTGTIQTDMHWGGGLHQFLQIYNGITLQAESLISIFMSYVEFFRKFKGKIYGVTGTLGGEAHREFLQKVYSPVTTMVIPTFAPKNFKEFKPIIVRDRGHWYLKTADFIMRQIKDKRPGLVIFELIEDVEKLRDYLIKIGYQDKHNQIFTLGTGGDDEDKIFKDYRLKIGDLVIATNAAGRGADFKISHEGLQNGGLHVIMTIFSKSMRVMQQALGRAARQGEAGSGQLIILVDEDEPCQDIQCLSENRDRSEIIKLKNDRLVMIPAMNIKDKLFSDYVEFMRLIAATMSYPIKLGMPKDSSGNQNILYLHQDQKDIYLTFVTRGGKKEIKITYIAERIDGNLKKRIKNILARPDATLADLSKYDYEAILFIAAEEGYLDQSDFKVSLLSDYAKIPAGNFNKNDRDRLGRYGDEQFDSKKFWQKYIYAGNTKKKFLLWLANRKQLSNEEEVDQLNENWAIWLRNQEKTINELFLLNSDELDLESLSTKRLQLKEKLYKEFEEFKKVNLLNFKKGELIVNSAYYVARADRYFLQRYFYYIDAKDPFRDPYLCDNEPWVNRILDEALRCANKALELDDYYTWAARSIRSAILLHRGGKEVKKMDDEDEKYEDKIKRAYEVKKQFFDDALSVIKNIRDVRIPVEESQLGYLLSMKSLNYTDQLAIQYVATRAIFNKMIEVERNNLKLVSKANEEEAIELNGFANIKDLADEINITQEIAETFGLNVADIPPIEFANKELVVRQIQAAGIDDIPKIKTYRLHDNRDFSGNFFGMLLGVVSIFTGTWMLGVFQGLFATAFATSMVMAGVGELLTYTYALIKGQPISFGQVLSSKGMSLAISFVTAGALSLLDQIPSIHSFLSRINLVDNLRSLGGNVGLAFAIQATTMATTGILYEFGRKIVDIDALKRDAREAINRIMEVCKEMLRRIFASDFFDDTSNLIGTLYRKIDAIMTGYMERFNGEGAVFGRGVATGLASNFLGGLPLVGHLINAGTEIITNTIKNTEAIGEISEQTVKAILETSGQATKTGVVMEKLLKGDFGKERGEKLMFEMHSQKFIVASEIDHANCSRLKGLKLNEELSPYKTGVIEECNHIHRIMSRDFAEDFEAFAVRFVDQVANLKNGIQKEIVKSTASVPGGILGKYFGERIYEYIKGKVERFKAGREQEVRSGGGGDPKWQQKEWSSKESADRAQKPKASQVTITPQPHADGKGQAKSGAKSGGDIPPRQGEPKSPAGSGGGANYQVKAGDSLSTIAAKILGPRAPPQAIHQMVKQLIRLNPGVAANPDLIQIGQYLRIPEARLDGSWGFTTDSTAGSYQGEWGMDQHSSAIWEGWEKGLRFSWADALWEKLTGTASASNLGGKPIEEPYWMRELCDYYQAGVLATGSAPGSLDPSKIPFDVDRFYEDLEDLASYEEPPSNQVYIEGMPLHEWEEQMVTEMSQAKGFYQKLKAIEGRLGGINRWVESDPELAQAVKHLNLHDQMPTAAAGSLYDVPTLGSWMLYKETGNKWYLLLMGIDIAGLGAVKSISGGGRARLGGVLKAVARADRTATEAKSSAAQGLGRIRNEIAKGGELTLRGNWKVGEDVYKPSVKGREPSWTTVKRRWWINEADRLTPEKIAEYETLKPGNFERMKQGKPPQRYSRDKLKLYGDPWESMELHHDPIPKREGGKSVIELWPREHAERDKYRHVKY